MALQVETIERQFKYQGILLPDLGPDFSVEQVKEFYGQQYAELTTAETIDHGIEGNAHVYEFRKAVGTKG